VTDHAEALGLFQRLLVTAGGLLVALILAAQVSAATPSAQSGGPGGKPFSDACPPGQILVGINYSGGKDLDFVQGLCRNFEGAAVSGNLTHLSQWGNTNGQGADLLGNADQSGGAVICPDGWAIQSLHISQSSHKTVHAFYADCWQPGSGRRTNTSLSSNKGGAGSPPGPAVGCDDTSYAAGLAGGSGGLVDRLGLLCEPIKVAAAAVPADTSPPLAKTQSVMIESTNFPGMFWRHKDWQGLLTKLESDLDFKDATFNLSPALTRQGRSGVSFESAEYPGYYLRHKNFVVVLEKNDGSALFAKDASFNRIKWTGSAGTAFESQNFPGMFIRHKDFRLVLNQKDGSGQFTKDAAFKIDPASAPPSPPAKPPIDVNNGDDNTPPPDNGGGQVSAATATTIYDQPAGNEVAYLDEGDPVTIVQCNDNNWCQISKPRKGWVWGDDLNH